MLLIQITAAHGPLECELAAKLTLQALSQELQQQALEVDVLEAHWGAQGLKSAVLAVRGNGAAACLRSWQGTIQWTFASPLRPGHPRKNWFVAVQACTLEQGAQPNPMVREQDLVFKACKASGKGGQHVNTTDSAVHALHLPSGVAVKVQTQRSQYANKQLARALIAVKLASHNQAAKEDAKKQRSHLHWSVVRGNPVRTFTAAPQRKPGRKGQLTMHAVEGTP